MLAQTGEYALRAAVYLAQCAERPVSSETIAQATQIPRRYLHHVLQALVRAGLVQSYPGPGGGYRFRRPAESVTVLDIVNAVSPIPRIRRCPLGLEASGMDLCPLHRALDQAAALVEEQFRSISLDQLLPKEKFRSPLCGRKSLKRATRKTKGAKPCGALKHSCTNTVSLSMAWQR